MGIRNSLLLSCSLIAGVATSAHAQTPTPSTTPEQAQPVETVAQSTPGQASQPTSAAANPEEGVADIVVTAQKRAERLQQVPIAITALTSAGLEQRGITGLANFQTSPAPGLQITPFAGDSSTLQLEIRGVSSIGASEGTVEAGTGIYIDDVYVSRAQGLGSELVDPERIEVLRGPQGTLFGRNSEGGAVRVVTKKPTGRFGGDARVTIGNYGKRRYEAHVNLPEVAGFSIKLDYINNERDPFTRNGTVRLPRLASQTGFGGESGEGYRAAVRWQPIIGLTLDYAYDNVKTTVDADYWHLFQPLGARPVDSTTRRNNTTWIPAFHEPFVTKAQSHTFTASYDLSDAITLKSITGYRRVRNAGSNSLMGAFSFLPYAALGIPGGALPVEFLTPGRGTTSLGLPAGTLAYAASGAVPYVNLRQNQWSEELQLVGKAGEFSYVFGGYYFSESVTDQRQNFFNIIYTDRGLTNAVGTNPYSLPFPGQGLTSQSVSSRSIAAFTQITWTPGFAADKLHITGGLRYTNDRKSFLRSLTGGTPVNIVPAPFKASRFDPAFTVAYELTPRINVYGKYAQAYRAGGVGVRSPTFAPFGAETNKSIEFGIKSDLIDRRLRINASVYQEKLQNVQTQVILNPVDPATSDTVNVPGYTLKGVELEMTAAPTDALSVTTSYTYQHGPGAFRVAGNAANYFVQNYPEHAVTAAVDWRLPELSFGRFVMHVDYSIASKAQGTPRVPDNTVVPATDRNVGNARLTLQDIPIGPTKLRIAAFANNIFDTAYPIYAAPGNVAVMSTPRTYGVEAGIRF